MIRFTFSKCHSVYYVEDFLGREVMLEGSDMRVKLGCGQSGWAESCSNNDASRFTAMLHIMPTPGSRVMERLYLEHCWSRKKQKRS